MVKYVLINDEVRINFEKNTHLAFGYSHPEYCYILDDYLKALSLWHRIENNKDWIIERHESGVGEKCFHPHQIRENPNDKGF